MLQYIIQEVKLMFYRGDEEKMCFLCEYSEKTDNEEILFCKKKNKNVSENSLCRKYKYDIFKREIKRKAKKDFSKFSKEDFEL